MSNQDPLFGPEAENAELRRQVTKINKDLEAAHSASNAMRQIRHQQAKIIEEQKKTIIELERQVKKLSG